MTTPERHPGREPNDEFGEAWHRIRAEWERGRPEREWRRQQRMRPGRRHRPPWGCLGCGFAVVVLVMGSTVAVAIWAAAAFLGFLAPTAAPSSLVVVAAAGVLLLALAVGARVVAGYGRPLADLAGAAERLADGEPGVRVHVRGPRPVRNLAASFNGMADRLDRSRTDRQALLADVTHELRTPLTVIAGGLEAMTDGVHPMDEDHVAPLLAETRVMDRLLDDLRTVSLAEAGALPLYREPTDLAAVAVDAVAAQRPMAAARGVRLEAEVTLPVVTSVDPVRAREILANLIANALRHTPRDGLVVVAARTEGQEAVLEVRDTGDGLTAEDLGRVFERFERRADTGGSGLGLTIVRDLATAHGGTVSASSPGPGRGATFRVRLPIRD